jgi:hypothetical protein
MTAPRHYPDAESRAERIRVDVARAVILLSERVRAGSDAARQVTQELTAGPHAELVKAAWR